MGEKRNITQAERDAQQLQAYRDRERRKILAEQLKKRRPDLSSSAINLIYFILMTNNRFATEPQVEVLDVKYSENAERVNGQLAMIGFVAAVGAYITTGQIIPGIF